MAVFLALTKHLEVLQECATEKNADETGSCNLKLNPIHKARE